MARIIGIDLGTTNSEAAYIEGGRPVIIPSQEGQTVSGKNFPSVVAFTTKGERLVGELAKRQAVMNPDGTLIQAKRKMGTDHKFRAKVGSEWKEFRPEEIGAMVLQKIKTDAEAFLGEKIEKAVITVPAYYDDDQRQATKDAGKIAGLEVVRIINEPTAAAFAYGIDKGTEGRDLNVIVLDFGGGTFDVTCMEMGEGVFEVKSTSGDTQLGGTDMDNALIDFLMGEFKRSNGVDLSKDLSALQRFRDAAERAKIELTASMQTNLNLPYISQNQAGPLHFEYTLTRAKMNSIIQPVLDRLDPPIHQAMKDAGWTSSDINKVILVGGPTRMPIVRERFEKVMNKKPEGGVDPMQCVAMGAALQAGVISGDVDELLLLDVTPLTLSVETLGGIATPMIERNTTIPTKKSQIYSTAADNQPSVEIHISQGERKFAKDNKSLGKFHLVGIPPAPRGVPQIEVTFDIDANGLLTVAAKDLGTSKSQQISISGSSQLKDDDIEKMVEEAKEYEEKDKEKQQTIELKNNADNLIYQGEKLFADNPDKVDEAEKKDAEATMEKLREAINKDDSKSIESLMAELQQKLQKIGAAFYPEGAQGAGGVPPPGAQPGPSTSPDDVVDVDYEVVDDDK
ncbi:MAG: molecular chaperone DnaK [Candidatus Hodarchaeales archaeon]|jgi:molecular chaperone DnaK